MLRKLRLDLAARVICAISVIWLSIALLTPTKGSQASCVMPTTGTVSGLVLVNDINACNGALLSLYSGAGAPSSPTTGMLWFNTTSNYIQQYDGANWSNLWFVDATNHLTTAPIGGGIVSASIASSGTTDIGSVPQSFVTVSGTTGITSLGSSATVGSVHIIKFSGSLVLTHNATSLILPGGQPITTQAGDIAFAIYLGSSNWQVLNYTPATGAAVTNAAVPLGTVLYGDFMTLPSKTVYGFGQALARSSFPGYLAAVTRAQTMTRTAGNATLASVADTSGMGASMPVEGPGIATGCTIASLVANTSITLNNGSCVTANGSATITVFGSGYGTGGDSTTVGVKDCRNRTMIGRGDMGGTDAGLITSAIYGANPLALNAPGGTQSMTLGVPNFPPYTPTGTNSITVTNGGNGSPLTFFSGGGGNGAGAGANAVSGLFAAGGVTITSGFTGVAQGGTSTPFGKIQPSVTAQCVVVVTP